MHTCSILRSKLKNVLPPQSRPPRLAHSIADPTKLTGFIFNHFDMLVCKLCPCSNRETIYTFSGKNSRILQFLTIHGTLTIKSSPKTNRVYFACSRFVCSYSVPCFPLFLPIILLYFSQVSTFLRFPVQSRHLRSKTLHEYQSMFSQSSTRVPGHTQYMSFPSATSQQ